MAEDVFGIVGSVIAGAYQVETVVAEGGFGVVYRCHHSGFRAPVALKCLKIPQQLGSKHQAEFLEQFRGEAELLFRLSASIPTVVRPLHVDAMTTPEGTFMPFMALEWLEGETLEAIVERRKEDGLSPLSLKKLIRLLTPVARALERAHNYMGPDGPISIVHRDLKPENIFVAKVAGEQVVKILDFGIGKAKSVASQVAGKASQTQSALASFTPAYGAPEQWVPKRFGQTGPWTDVWGLAITMVEVMAGRPIIDGDQAAMMGTCVDPSRRPTPRTEGLVVSDEVEAVFARALAVDPRERYPEAGAFWNELVDAAGVVEERPVSARPSHGPIHDNRSEGGAVPRVETFGSSHSSGMQPRVASDMREAATMDAASLDAPALAAMAQGVEVQVAAAAPAPVSVPIPELALDNPPPRGRTRSSDSLPRLSGVVDFDDGGAVDLALDLAPGEEPSRRLSSGTMHAVRGSSSSPPGSVRPSVPGAAAAAARSSSNPPISGATTRSSPNWSVPGPDSRRATTEPEPGMARPSGFETRSDHPGVQPAGRKEATLLRRVLPGAALLLASIVLTLVNNSVAASSGSPLSLGPLKAGWVAGFLMVAGLALLVYRLLPRGSS